VLDDERITEETNRGYGRTKKSEDNSIQYSIAFIQHVGRLLSHYIGSTLLQR
jgi:hypothetical protein